MGAAFQKLNLFFLFLTILQKSLTFLYYRIIELSRVEESKRPRSGRERERERKTILSPNINDASNTITGFHLLKRRVDVG